MPAHVKIEGIYPPKNVMSKKGDDILAAIFTALERPVTRRLTKAMEARMRGWSNPSQIGSDLQDLGTRFSLLVEPKGKGRIKWERVSGGVDQHPISAKRAPVLRIKGGKGGYKPHTAPGNVYGGPGSYNSNDQYAKAILHPGIKPREFEKHIVREEEGAIRRDIVNAAERAAR